MSADPTRDKIVKVASRIFGRYGFQKTTMLCNYLLTRMKILSEAINYHETLKADFLETFEFLD